MPRLSPSELRSGVLVPVLILVLGAAGYFLVWPKYQDLKAAREQAQVLASELAAKRESLGKIQNLVGKLEAEADTLAPLNEAIPTAPRIPELLANLDYLAGQSGMLVIGIDVAPLAETAPARGGRRAGDEAVVPNTENIATIKATLTLRGLYINLTTFLANLEQNLRLLDAHFVSATAAAEGESAGLDFVVEVRTYYQK